MINFQRDLIFPSIDVRLRGLRLHDQGAGTALRPPEAEPPLQSGPPQVLRQAALQVQQL